MSIASMKSAISSYFDKLADARFRRDGEGRLIFLPFGFGRGRIVPDAAREARLRQASRRLMIGVLAVIIPVAGAMGGMMQTHGGGAFLLYFMGCVAAGFVTNLYPWWLSRDLPKSGDRVSYIAASMGSLDRFSMKFLWFGLATSVVFSATGLVSLLLPAARMETSLVMPLITLLVFLPMTAVYWLAIRKRRAS